MMMRANRGRLLSFSYTSETVSAYRKQILSELKTRDPDFMSIPVRRLRTTTLPYLLKRYDELFLDHFLEQTYGKRLTSSLSGRLTISAGKFIYPKRMTSSPSGEIRMSIDFLSRLRNEEYHLNGLTTHGPQESFLVVLEHEIVHAIEYGITGNTGHSSIFQSIAWNLFKHTETTHNLPTRATDAAKIGLVVGKSVSFDYKGKRLTGTVSYVGKTVSVMVPDSKGSYVDRFGRHYSKYRCAYSNLHVQTPRAGSMG